MNRYLLILAALIAVGCATSATAALSVTPGTPVHTHSDANTGGATLSNSTLTGIINGSPTLSGTWYNGTYSGSVFTGTTTMTAKLSSNKACVAGFVRKSPNYCMASPPFNDAVPVGSGPACLTSNALFPADATIARMLIALTLQSQNAVGYRQAAVNFGNGAAPTMTNADVIAVANAYEYVATVGTEVGAFSVMVDVPLTSTGQYCFGKTMSGGTWARTTVLGYYD